MIGLSTALALLIVSGALHAADAPPGDVKAWKRYQSAGEKAFKARDSIEAEKQFLLAVQEAERLPKGESRLRDSLQDLAPLMLSHRKYRDAQMAYERLRGLYEKELGSNNLRVAGALIGVGQACSYGSRYAEAETALLRARKIIEMKSGAFHPDMVYVQSSLAAVYRQTLRYAEAEALYKTAIQIAESPQVKTEFAGGGLQQTQYRPRYELAAGLRNDLALLYQTQSRFAEAEAMLKRTLKDYEEASGANSAGAALALHNLGVLYLRQKQLPEAQRSLGRALTIREQAFGARHPAVAETLDALAGATEPENAAQAGRLRARAREIRAAAR